MQMRLLGTVVVTVESVFPYLLSCGQARCVVQDWQALLRPPVGHRDDRWQIASKPSTVPPLPQHNKNTLTASEPAPTPAPAATPPQTAHAPSLPRARVLFYQCTRPRTIDGCSEASLLFYQYTRPRTIDGSSEAGFFIVLSSSSTSVRVPERSTGVARQAFSSCSLGVAPLPLYAPPNDRRV